MRAVARHIGKRAGARPLRAGLAIAVEAIAVVVGKAVGVEIETRDGERIVAGVIAVFVIVRAKVLLAQRYVLLSPSVTSPALIMLSAKETPLALAGPGTPAGHAVLWLSVGHDVRRVARLRIINVLIPAGS